MSNRAFVLQALDPETGAPVVEARLRSNDIQALRDILGLPGEDERDLQASYSVERDDLQKLGALSDPPFEPDAIFTVLTPWHSIREAPYLIHTDFELLLMLEGRKPLAVFNDAYPSHWYDSLLARFDAPVRERRLFRRLIERPFAKPQLNGDARFLGMREAYFALPAEEWRIDAYIRLWETASLTGWNDDLERREGSLLGYEDWQNDWWITHRKNRLSCHP